MTPTSSISLEGQEHPGPKRKNYEGPSGCFPSPSLASPYSKTLSYKTFEVKSAIRAQQAPRYIDLPAHRWHQLCACHHRACPWGGARIAFVRPLDTPSVHTPGVCQHEPGIQIKHASSAFSTPQPPARYIVQSSGRQH